MPPPDRMLNTLRSTIDAVDTTTGRVGHLVRLQDCDHVLVAGDLHGRVAHFQTILKAADEFLRKVDSELLISGRIPTDDGHLVPNTKQLIVDCSASPAADVLFRAGGPITQADLIAGIVTL